MQSGCGVGVDISTFSSALWSLGIEASAWESRKLYTQVQQSAGFCKGHDLAVSSSVLCPRRKKVSWADGVNSNVGNVYVPVWKQLWTHFAA